jgi:hypothetical protein
LSGNGEAQAVIQLVQLPSPVFEFGQAKNSRADYLAHKGVGLSAKKLNIAGVTFLSQRYLPFQ